MPKIFLCYDLLVEPLQSLSRLVSQHMQGNDGLPGTYVSDMLGVIAVVSANSGPYWIFKSFVGFAQTFSLFFVRAFSKPIGCPFLPQPKQ